MTKVAIVCELVAKPGRKPELLDALDRIARVCDDEPGTEAYVVMDSATDDDAVVLFELFTDEAAYQEHRAHPVHEEVVSGLDDLLGDGSRLSQLRPVSHKLIDHDRGT
ncbi:MAG: Antibiotic biosynthesis monooxygenase [Acidimicrobiales bacterium]|nr:Antibiotic biosynthesis monooxygenase [Acidimicrobiales bacterium]